jgi:D-cysteine desulfhydrase
MFTAMGSCGTHAGILVGAEYFRSTIPVYGISVSRSNAECLQRIPVRLQKTADLLEHPLPLDDGDVIVTEDYLGPGYALITPAARQAIYKVAQIEGIFLDPVYTGKTMAALIDLVRRGEIQRGATVVFWHTGVPGLFGFPQDFGRQ